MGSCILNNLYVRGLVVIKVFSDRFSYHNFNIRYTLVDTLEANQIGIVIEEGFGEDYFQITLELKKKLFGIKKVIRLLKLMGLNEGLDYVITYKAKTG